MPTSAGIATDRIGASFKKEEKAKKLPRYKVAHFTTTGGRDQSSRGGRGLHCLPNNLHEAA